MSSTRLVRVRRPLLHLLAFLLLATAGAAVAQDLHPSRRPSPMGLARTTLDDGTYVSIVYSRPYLRDRENIFGTKESGALVPFGEIWRTGANEATQITTTGDVTIGGKTLPAGTYSLFTVPGAERWTVHFNSALGLNGTMRRNPESGDYENAYDPANDVVVVEATPAALAEPVDQMTFAFEEAGDDDHLVLSWASTELRLPIAAAE